MTSTALAPRSIVVTLLQGDDLARAEELEAAVNTASVGAIPRIGDTTGILDAAAAYDRFITEAEGRAFHITLQALPRRQWRDLLMKHPARGDVEADKANGFNVDTLGDDLVAESVILVQVGAHDPFTWSRRDLDGFLDALSDGDFSRLFSAAVRLNTDSAAAPKADLSSRLTQLFTATSKSPASSG